jgi:hypothetical protein
VVDLAAIFYLAKVTLHYMRNRPNPQ